MARETGLQQLQDTAALVDWHFQEFFDLFSNGWENVA